MINDFRFSEGRNRDPQVKKILPQVQFAYPQLQKTFPQVFVSLP